MQWSQSALRKTGERESRGEEGGEGGEGETREHLFLSLGPDWQLAPRDKVLAAFSVQGPVSCPAVSGGPMQQFPG